MLQRTAPSRALERPRCRVCGEVLRYLDALAQEDPGFPCCAALVCRQVAERRARMDPRVFSHYLATQQAALAARREAEAAEARRIQELEAREADEERALLARAAPDGAGAAHALPIPSGRARTAPPSPERLARYRAHLEELVERAAGHADEEAALCDQTRAVRERRRTTERTLAANPDLRRLSDRLCALCRGGCCSEGAEHAYLTVVTVRRFRDANPGLSPDAVVQAYLGRVAERTIEDACINQTPSGCALPRAMRSDSCNAYYCDPLRAFQQASRDAPDLGRVLAIQRRNTHWRRFDPGSPNEIVRVAWVWPGEPEPLELGAAEAD